VRLSSNRQKRWLRELEASGLCGSIKGIKPARKEADARAAVLLEPLPELFAYILPIFTFEFRCAGQAGAGFETVYMQGGDRRVVRLSELCAAADAAVILKVNPYQVRPRGAGEGKERTGIDVDTRFSAAVHLQQAVRGVDRPVHGRARGGRRLRG